MNTDLTIATRITLLRIIAVPIFIISVLLDKKYFSLFIFLFCMITDFMDGYFAKSRKEETNLGAMLDPIADKFLLISSFGIFAAIGKINIWVSVVILIKDLMIMIGWWFRSRITDNKSVNPSIFGKITTFLEMMLVLFLILGIRESVLLMLVYLMVFAVVVSTLGYMFTGWREINTKC